MRDRFINETLEKVLQDVPEGQWKELHDHRSLAECIRSLGYSRLKNHLPELFGLILRDRFGDMSKAIAEVLREGGEETAKFLQVLFRMNVLDLYEYMSILKIVVDGWEKKWMQKFKPYFLDLCRQQLEGRGLHSVVDILLVYYKNKMMTKQEIRAFIGSFDPPYQCLRFTPKQGPDYIADAVELEVFLDREDYDYTAQLTEFQLRQLVSEKYIKDGRAGMLFLELGFSRLKRYTPELLEFLMDINWPAAGYAASILIEGGREVVPDIRKVFQDHADDDTWCYWIVTNVVAQLDAEVIAELKEDIFQLCRQFLSLAIEPKPEMIMEFLEVPYRKGVMTKKELLAYFQSIESTFKGEISADDLMQIFEKGFWDHV